MVALLSTHSHVALILLEGYRDLLAHLPQHITDMIDSFNGVIGSI